MRVKYITGRCYEDDRKKFKVSNMKESGKVEW